MLCFCVSAKFCIVKGKKLIFQPLIVCATLLLGNLGQFLARASEHGQQNLVTVIST